MCMETLTVLLKMGISLPSFSIGLDLTPLPYALSLSEHIPT
jgi:hypothetical protein